LSFSTVRAGIYAENLALKLYLDGFNYRDLDAGQTV
jgi:hypothetical protein